MRTTLDIDDSILAAARSLARARGSSIGAAVSELARRGLSSPPPEVSDAGAPFPVLRGATGHVVTDELVAAHRDD